MKTILVWFMLFSGALLSAVELDLSLEKPSVAMTMGDKPVFTSVLQNRSTQPVVGTVLYLSLVNLDKGQEHPVDLEDWSAQKAVHIDRLECNASFVSQWPMRLIQSGRYGVFVTAVLPQETQPVTSSIVHFDIQPKKTIVPSRIWPVAIGVPLLILLLMGAARYQRRRHD